MFVALAPVLGCAPEHFPDAPQTRAQDSRLRLRFVDINVWSGLDYEGNLWMGEYEEPRQRENRYAILLKGLRELQPDLIGVHEANKLPEYARRLARDLGYDEIHHVGVGGVRAGPFGLPWNLREGDALLARPDLGLISAGREQLSGGPVGRFFTFHLSDATQILGGRVTLHGRPVFVFTTHWHASLPDSASFRREVVARIQRERKASPEQAAEAEREMREGGAWRREEARRTLEFVRRVAGPHPFVLMGDFNATEDSAEIAALRSAGLTDAFRTAHPQAPGFTWVPAANLNQLKYYNKKPAADSTLRFVLESSYDGLPKRIDFVFCGQRQSASAQAGPELWLVRDARVVLDRAVDGQHASDHFGVLADLELR